MKPGGRTRLALAGAAVALVALTKRHWRWMAGLWAVWVAVALVFGLQGFAIRWAIFGERSAWWRPFAVNLLCYQFWWLLTPLVLHLGRRHPLERGWRARKVHAFAGLLIPALHLGFWHLLVIHRLHLEIARPPTVGRQLALLVGSNLHLEVLTYWAIVSIQSGLRIGSARHAEELRAARLEARLSEARVLALRMQLQPHFLFNALNGISALIHDDPEAADTLLVRLGDFLRLGLETAGEHEVPLAAEKAYLCRYLEIEQVRFSDRLRVDFDIAAPTASALVPSLILQPLVENAIRHGIARREESGRLSIVARAEGARLRITVHNDGPPLSSSPAGGIGLANCRSRLAEMYGREADLTVADDPQGGVTATLCLPLRLSQATAERLAKRPSTSGENPEYA